MSKDDKLLPDLSEDDFESAVDELLAGSDDEEILAAAELCEPDTSKLTAVEAGYMELEGARKDSGCKIVSVEGGVSSEMGCCNLFRPLSGAKTFSCGMCKYQRNL